MALLSLPQPCTAGCLVAPQWEGLHTAPSRTYSCWSIDGQRQKNGDNLRHRRHGVLLPVRRGLGCGLAAWCSDPIWATCQKSLLDRQEFAGSKRAHKACKCRAASRDEGEGEEPSAAQQKQAAVQNRLDAARKKASEYSAEKAAPPPEEPDDSDSDDEPSLGKYGALSLLLGRKEKKESFYKNAVKELPKPAVLPEIEILKGKKVVSERKLKPEDQE